MKELRGQKYQIHLGVAKIGIFEEIVAKIGCCQQ